MKLLELFGGIGACTQALKRLHVPLEIVDYVEIDKYAVQSYNAINGTHFAPQDITKWDKDIEVDLIMHGSPCQDFSIAGKQAGADEGSGTRSSLMYETLRIVSKLKPKFVIWENVKNVLSKKHIHNFEAYLEKMVSLGYTNYYQVLNAKDYGVPQNRERIFCVSVWHGNDFSLDGYDFVFPKKFELKKRLKDVLECEVDEKYYLSDELTQTLQNQLKDKNAVCIDLIQWRREGTPREYNDIAPCLGARDYKEPRCVQVGSLSGGKWDKMHEISRRVYNGEGLAPTIHTCGGGNIEPKVIVGAAHQHNMVAEITENLRIRKLTPKECWRLMGFSDECFDKAEKVNSNTQLYKQAGNSIVVDVLAWIFRNLLLKQHRIYKKD